MSERLETDGVTRRYDGRAVVDGVSLRAEAGEITALLGGSGAGKSTLLRLIAGFEPVESGEIRLGGVSLSVPGRTMAPERRRIGLIFQDFALFPHLTAARNVAFGLRHLGREEAAARTAHWIGLLGLGHRAGAFPHELSGGEQQRVAIARALAPQPAAILMDEPFSGLDPALSDAVRDAALAAIRAAGIPALMVTHDPAEAMAHADRIAILDQGRLLQCGAARDVYQRPASLAAARALGPVNVLAPDRLPAPWRSGSGGGAVGVRPEGVIVDDTSPVRLTITRRHLAGPLTRLTLDGEGLHLTAFCAHSERGEPGESVGVRLDPGQTFALGPAET